MVKRRVKFTFPSARITEPIIYQLGQEFAVVTNIRRADVREDAGWVVLELAGDEAEVTRSIDWVIEKGVRVDPIVGNVVEG